MKTQLYQAGLIQILCAVSAPANVEARNGTNEAEHRWCDPLDETVVLLSYLVRYLD